MSFRINADTFTLILMILAIALYAASVVIWRYRQRSAKINSGESDFEFGSGGITYDIRTRPNRDAGDSSVRDGIPTLTEADMLREQLGGPELFDIYDSNGKWVS